MTECRICGKPLLLRQKQFCSRKCLNTYNSIRFQEGFNPWMNREPVERVCHVCGTLFSTKNPMQSRCHECIKFNRHRCSRCGAVIEGWTELCTDCGGRGPRTANRMCRILTDHAETLVDDPERLSTDFILKICRKKVNS